MIALRKRRERNLSLSHRRPGFIGVFYAGDAANLLLKEPRRNPTKWHNPTRSNARHNPTKSNLTVGTRIAVAAF